MENSSQRNKRTKRFLHDIRKGFYSIQYTAQYRIDNLKAISYVK